MDPRLVAWHYMGRRLCLDLFCVSLDWFECTGDSLEAGFRWLRLLRLLRVTELDGIRTWIADRITSERLKTFLSIGKTAILLLSMSHVITCAWYSLGIIGELQQESNWLAKSG